LGPLLNNERLRPIASHMIDRYLELLRPLGIDSPRVRFMVPNDARSATNVQAFLCSSRLDSFAVLNPGAGWDSRLWPADRYGEVAKHLAQRHGLRSVVTWAGPRELAWARAIVAAATRACRAVTRSGPLRRFRYRPPPSRRGPRHALRRIARPDSSGKQRRLRGRPCCSAGAPSNRIESASPAGRQPRHASDLRAQSVRRLRRGLG
jgi:hypothetical protein